MGLHALLRKKRAHFHLDLELTCGKGETLCVVGPSGSGKTTLLRLLAGLDRPDSGFTRLDGQTWSDSEEGVFLAPQRRSAGLAFQDAALFPHMTLRRNVEYAAKDKETAAALLEIFGLAHLEDARPARLSGGERQRGALCQALARQPRLLLLDEPFSALDLETRIGLRQALRRIQAERPVCLIHVTHDLDEALFLGDRILAVVEGRAAPEWLKRQMELLRTERLLTQEHTERPTPAAGAASQPAARPLQRRPAHA